MFDLCSCLCSYDFDMICLSYVFPYVCLVMSVVSIVVLFDVFVLRAKRSACQHPNLKRRLTPLSYSKRRRVMRNYISYAQSPYSHVGTSQPNSITYAMRSLSVATNLLNNYSNDIRAYGQFS